MFEIVKFKNKQSIKYITIISLFLISTSFSLIYLIFYTNPKNTSVSSNINNQIHQPTCKYFIKDIEGKINIFENNSSKPLIILEKPTVFLPEYDQKMLKEGIYINNLNELSELIEDYTD